MNKLLIFSLLIPCFIFAQSNWKRSENNAPKKVELFHSSKTANFPTTENLIQGNFVFEISHRFAAINEGYDNFFGLDGPANIRIALGYGVTNDLMITLGRSNVLANLDLAIKYKLMDLTSKNYPSSLGLNAGASLVSRDENFEIQTFNTDYMQYFAQLVYNVMLMEKKLAIGIVPSFVYNSYIFAASQDLDTESTIAIGTYYQYYINRLWSIWAEYTAVVSGYNGSIVDNNTDAYNPIAFGTDIETGGHIFHLFITNSTLLNPTQFLVGSNFDTDSDAWRFGFGITREL